MSTLAVPAFNPLKFANKLKDAGIPDKQAEAEADALHEALTQTVSALESKMATLENHAKQDAVQFATKDDMRKESELLRKEIVLARRDIILWLGGALVIGFGLVLRYLSKLPL